MAQAIVSVMTELIGAGWLARFRRSIGSSLTSRILAVNIIALGLLAGSLFYLDSYRNRLLAERMEKARGEVEIAAAALAVSNRAQRRALLTRIGTEQKLRLRLFGSNRAILVDSFDLAEPSYHFVDPNREPWYQGAARSLDRGMDFLLGSPEISAYREAVEKPDGGWPEVTEARAASVTAVRQRMAPDRTPVINAAAPVGSLGQVLLTTRNATDITQNVRNARQTLAIIVVTALLTSILLSLFLARTIVQPLRMLVRAAVRVRLGRDREVIVPRLPERRDEIGLLARAISDMTSALRQRIDAVETFAADVAHEVKNPLASLRSALETLDRVSEPKIRRQLLAIATHDTQRLDRLVTEIADASRIDAELSRATFEELDISALIDAVVSGRQVRGTNRTCSVKVEWDDPGPWSVAGDAVKLERVLQNLLDNAVSFSPTKGTILVQLEQREDEIIVSVSDNGPGIPEEARERVFERFHSLRPDGEDFGNHSGLGLAIARTIVEAHDGTLTAQSQDAGSRGARLVFTLRKWRNA